MITIPNPPSGTFGSYKLPEQPRKSALARALVVLAFILIAAAVYYVFFYLNIGVSLRAPALAPAPPISSLDKRIGKLPNFDFSVLDGAFYKSLKMYGTVPVVPDSLGRANPFVPY